MQKMIIAAMVLLLAQLGLLVAFYIGDSDVPVGGADSLFLAVTPDAVQSLEITDGEGKKAVLEKGSDGWVVSNHFKAPVEGNRVTTFLDKLATIKQGFVVATSKEAARRFKVDSESFENHIIVKAGDKTVADFYVGTSPGLRQVHARLADSEAIVTISMASHEFESEADGWLDSSLATIKDEDLIGLNFSDFTLKKADNGWQLEDLLDTEKINQNELDTLVTNASNLRIEDVLDPTEVAGLFAEPTFRYTAVLKQERKVDYLFAKTKDESYALKLSDRDLYFKVAATSADELVEVSRGQLLDVVQAEESTNEQVDENTSEQVEQ